MIIHSPPPPPIRVLGICCLLLFFAPEKVPQDLVAYWEGGGVFLVVFAPYTIPDLGQFSLLKHFVGVGWGGHTY